MEAFEFAVSDLLDGSDRVSLGIHYDGVIKLDVIS